MGEMTYLACPFCSEPDFDINGLKGHLSLGYCEAYNDTKSIQEMSWDELEAAKGRAAPTEAGGEGEGERP